ncbi:MAG: hypothetical protein FWD85_06905 [Microbacteriaceae bacterium]|nr:hypothetical protein [Microbacteriaceae bacterium]MCL2795020.1 hypothetical protein [Microbacteriaceae bacterium]
MSTPTSSAFWPSLSAAESRIELSRRPLGRQLVNVLALYAVSRIFSTLLLALGLWFVIAHDWHIPWQTATPSFFMTPNGWFPHLPTFTDASELWDSAHYTQIAQSGYPVVLPRGADGAVQPNNWAFLPVYPMLVGVLAWALGTGFGATGAVASLVFGAAATIVLYLIVRDRAGYRPAWFAATVFSFGPLAFLLQTAYAESLFLFLMFAAIYLMQRRRYWWMLVPAVLTCFTRPGGAALALALLVVFVARWRETRETRDAFPVRERIAVLAAAVVTGLAGVAWPVIAWAVTGTLDAYTATELSWRNGFLGHTQFRPFAAWFGLAWRYLGIGGVALMAAAVLLFALWVRRRGIRTLGVEIVATCVSYALYLLAVFMPQQSVFRVAMPLAPLIADRGIIDRPWLRRLVLAVAVAGQAVCVMLLWFYANP